MSYSINGECIVCGMCAEICPVEAVRGEDDPDSIDQYRFIIDMDACVDCGECAQSCPAEAIQNGEN